VEKRRMPDAARCRIAILRSSARDKEKISALAAIFSPYLPAYHATEDKLQY
jgi:hypothetical protein